MLQRLFEQYQIGALPYGAIFILIYIFAAPSCESSSQEPQSRKDNQSDGIILRVRNTIIRFVSGNEVYVCLLASLASQVVGFTPLVKIIISSSPATLFLVYAAIYFTVLTSLHTYKVMIACFIMGFFELIMYKAFLNELGNKDIEDSLYIHYENIVTLLHVFIVLSLVSWGRIRSSYRVFSNNLLRPFMYNCLLLPYRG